MRRAQTKPRRGPFRGHLHGRQRLQVGQRLDRPSWWRCTGQAPCRPSRFDAAAGAALARVGGDEFAVALTGKAARDTAAGAASAIVHSLDQPFTVHGFEFHVTRRGRLCRRDRDRHHPERGGPPRRPCHVPGQDRSRARSRRLSLDDGDRRAREEAGRDRPSARRRGGRAEGPLPAGGARLATSRSSASKPWCAGPRASSARSRRRSSSRSPRRPAHPRARPYRHRSGVPGPLQWPDLKMAINVSPVQLREPEFRQRHPRIVERYGLSPHQFELELTEGILVNNPTIAKRKLATLKDLGFSSRSTISAPASPRSAISASFPSTCSRSIAPSCATSV